MKKVMLTALTISLLAGTSAFAGSGGAAASVRMAQDGRGGHAAPEAQHRSEGQSRPERQAPAAVQRPTPQQAPQNGARPDGGRGGRERGPGDYSRGQRPAQAQVAPGQAARPAPPRASGSFVGRTLEDAQRRAEAQGRGGDWNNNNNGRGRGPDWNNGRGGRDGDWNNGRGGNWNNNNGRGPDWDRDRWNRDRNRPRYDQRYWPHFVQPRQQYRWYGSPWMSQPGFYYRDWGYGEVLPWSWYTPNYYLNDYWRYGLPLPPAGYEWVRVGRDVMLVDVFTGRIQQVVRYLFF